MEIDSGKGSQRDSDSDCETTPPAARAEKRLAKVTVTEELDSDDTGDSEDIDADNIEDSDDDMPAEVLDSDDDAEPAKEDNSEAAGGSTDKCNSESAKKENPSEESAKAENTGNGGAIVEITDAEGGANIENKGAEGGANIENTGAEASANNENASAEGGANIENSNNGEAATMNNLYDNPEAGPSNIAASASTSLDANETPEIQITDEENMGNVVKALDLNQQLQDKYTLLFGLLTTRLDECHTKLAEVRESLKEDETENTFEYKHCGMPYFKDHEGNHPPEDPDTTAMHAQNLPDFCSPSTSSVSTWTVKDKCEFSKIIINMSRNLKRQDLEAQLKQLKKDKASKEDKMKLQCQITMLTKMNLEELALPIDKEYDWAFVSKKLKKRHSPEECSTMWKLFLHPSINKQAWTRSEHRTLKSLVKKYNAEDWEKIAEELNTNRTGYQCFVYYRANMYNADTKRPWTEEEIEQLVKLIEYHKTGNYIPWGAIATEIKGRTKVQIYNKYLKLIEKKKGRFTPEEDSVILNFVRTFGKKFKQMTKYLPDRSTVQLRNRYQLLVRIRLSATWTVEEDRKLLQVMANQDKNTDYSKATKYFPGKDRTNIRSRYMTLQKWMKAHPNCDLENAPRRGARRLMRGQAKDDLENAVEALQKKKESPTKRNKKLSQHSTHEEIDQAIISALYNEELARKKQESRAIVPARTEVVTDNRVITNLRNVLVLMHANLKKKRFLASPYNTIFPTLADVDYKAITVMKIKSYSKKERITLVPIDEKKRATLWGNKVLGNHDYVMPPSYETITGCRQLIQLVSENMENQQTPSTILAEKLKTSKKLRDKMELLKKRFAQLFLWPMLLSDIPPMTNNNVEVSEIFEEDLPTGSITPDENKPLETKVAPDNDSSDEE